MRSRIHATLIRSALLFALLASRGAANGQTTAFTYQGQLRDGGGLPTGSYDLRFGLYDSASGPSQIGSNQTLTAVAVNGGVFTVQLDFGANAFPGANRFLEIGVKPAASGSFTALTPRQQISSAPYSIRTLSAATADALSSACVGCVQNAQIGSVAGSKISGAIPAASVPSGSGSYVQNGTAQQSGANFNIGGNGTIGGNLTVTGTLNANVAGNFIQNRTTPQSNANFNVSGNGTLGGTLSAGKVEVAAQEGLVITGFEPFLTLRDSNANNARGIVSSGFGDLGFYVESSIGSTPTVLIKNTTGNVGIGAASPVSKLDVRGNLTLESGTNPGIFTAASGGEKNRYLSLVNSPDTPSASGLKAGGVLVADDYGFGNPGKSDLIVKGNLGVGTASPTSGRLQSVGGGTLTGVYGTTSGHLSASQSGVYGGSSALGGRGVMGEVNSGYGVWGASPGGDGVHGEGTTGVYGKSTAGGNAVLADGTLSVSGSAFVGGNVHAIAFVETSDRNAKANFTDVQPRTVLDKLASIPIQSWNFRSEPETVRHLGPVAQDFRAAFDLGADDVHIATVDADGVALASIQGLYQIVEEKDRELQELQARVRRLESELQTQSR